LLADLPRLASANFRYYVNGENMGQAGNWNRGIELGRGEWHTMLHDDDLLLPDFAAAMMFALAAHPRMDGLICRKRLFGPGVVETKSRSRDLAKRAFVEARFRGSETRRYRPSRFFWASGNPVGLVARKADLLALGGYQPDEYPIFDHHLQLRFAVRHRLYESRRILAMIRLFENEWMRPDVVKSVITRFHELRMNMAGSVVPRWWGRLSPMVMENHRRLSNRDSGCEVSRGELEAETGIALPQVNPAALQALRLSLGGY
jgi:glycosyltransferase involved in cell wall biosynthesis